ncbi:nucleotide exchange factor GrpE [Actinomycetospora straminea]|uniref:Protein GrpE n=1 Tax=Actinomycetospora straminea TaxID=663607 RepID=A0ABP9FA07_9PSEU|nr:nucleotide exchange factor GrpE [Actinomycetospora straminea]MDD7934074.1 nucleotide exchange factor GrpE [Actinomycetospora straminea]
MQDPVVGQDGADATDVPTDSSVGGVPTSGQDAPGGTAQADGVTDGGETAAPDGAEAVAAEARAAQSAAEASAASGTAEAGAPAPDPELERVRAELAERTADLQRVSAEFANYRRRTERERESTVAGAKASVAGELLTVLDDVERAQTHGDLTGPFKVVADRLTETLHRAGLQPFGAEGDAFDPSVHEAVAHETSPDVSAPTVTTVMRRGYRFGDKVLRAAMVGVTDSDGTAPATTPSEPADAGRS